MRCTGLRLVLGLGRALEPNERSDIFSEIIPNHYCRIIFPIFAEIMHNI